MSNEVAVALDARLAFDAKTLAEALCLSERTVRKLRNTPGPDGIRFFEIAEGSRRLLTSRKEVERWLDHRLTVSD